MSRLIWSGSSWSGRERHCSFLNLTDGTFADVSAILGLDFADDGRALAATDWDGDGDLDLWFKNRTGPQLRFMRNDGAAGHFVSLRLTGTKCNRDAIGARVEVRVAGRRIVKTVTAGSGYLAQSSKRLHFGLGQSETIEGVVVRWPDGSIENLPPLEVDQNYDYVQASGEAKPSATSRVILGRGNSPALPKLLAAGRTVLREPMPLPPDALGGATSSVGGSTLINFWAQWCANCQVELAEFTKHADQLAAAGLKIVPLCVDPPEDREKARSVAADLKMPYSVRFVDEAGMTLIVSVLKSVLDIHSEMAIPMSLLLDSRGAIRIIYTGPVSVEQLLADRLALAGGSARGQLATSPYPGRWYAAAKRRYADIVDDLKQAKLLDWARFYLKLDRQSRSR